MKSTATESRLIDKYVFEVLVKTCEENNGKVINKLHENWFIAECHAT